MIAVNPAGSKRFFISPNGASLLRTKLYINRTPLSYSSHLSKNSGGLNLIGILFEHGRELRRKLFHLELKSLSLAEADSIFLALELQLHHIVRIAETPVAGELISELSVSG